MTNGKAPFGDPIPDDVIEDQGTALEAQIALAHGRIDELERRLATFAMREMATEVLFASAVGFLAWRVPEALSRELFDELRSSVTVKGEGRDPKLVEQLQLEQEEHAAQLIDKMQRFASSLRDARGKEPS